MKKKVLFFVIVLVLVGIATTFTIIGINSSKVDTTEPEESVESNIVNANGEEIKFLNKDATLSDIKKIEGVVNVYMFWGNGCPHCKTQWQWLETLRDEYTGKIAIYGFEVFNNSENRILMDNFAYAMGDGEVNTVPYTIVGDKSFDGFGNSSTTGKNILNAIEKARKNGADIYFDKIKSK